MWNSYVMDTDYTYLYNHVQMYACMSNIHIYIHFFAQLDYMCIYIYRYCTVYVCYIMPRANPYLLNMATYRERERVELLFISILDYLSVPAVLLTF